jgi:hypothetical protein
MVNTNDLLYFRSFSSSDTSEEVKILYGFMHICITHFKKSVFFRRTLQNISSNITSHYQCPLASHLFSGKKILLTIALCCVENLQLPTNMVNHIYLETTFGA